MLLLLDAIAEAVDRIDALELEMRAVAVEFAAIAARVDAMLDDLSAVVAITTEEEEFKVRALLERVVVGVANNNNAELPGDGGLDATSTP